MALSQLLSYVNRGGDSVLQLEASLGAHIICQGDGTFWTDGDPVAVQSFINAWSPLPNNKTQKLAALTQVYGGKFLAGRTLTVGTVTANYQIDPASISNIQAEGTIAGDVVNNTPGAPVWDPNYFWIAANNSHTPMTAAQCFAFAGNVRAYVRGLILQNRALKDAIAAATTQAQLDAIDVTAGWPSNP